MLDILFQSRNRHRLCFGLLSAEVRFYFYFASSEFPHLEPPNLDIIIQGSPSNHHIPSQLQHHDNPHHLHIKTPHLYVSRKKKPLASIQTPILLADTPFPLPQNTPSPVNLTYPAPALPLPKSGGTRARRLIHTLSRSVLVRAIRIKCWADSSNTQFRQHRHTGDGFEPHQILYVQSDKSETFSLPRP